jgi:2-C-methyl-D-erythritol 4-phosphate cytidylyltransferase
LNACVILAAAGHGRRFGPAHQRPKQFRPLRGKPLLYWPLKTFASIPLVRSVVLVVGKDYLAWARAFVRREKLRKVAAVVEGGAERADSVRRGFAAAPPSDVVLVHDAARALVTRAVVERVAQAAWKNGVALAAWPVPDTLKLSKDGRRVARTVPRDHLWLAQTPQGFRRSIAAKVFDAKGPRPTDDVRWAERAGRRVALVTGSPENFKVTLPEDFTLCGAVLAGRRG